MALEFKRLSDVEVVAEPTESANVLIEEDGVIKKAPKTAVGGGSTEWDAVIDLGTDTDDSECALWSNAYASARFVSGGYDTIMAKLNNNEMPHVLLYGAAEVYSVLYNFKTTASSVVTSKEGMTCVYNVYGFPYGGIAYITFDSTNTFTKNNLWS